MRIWIVDYDINTGNPAKRRQFYRRLQKIIGKPERSTLSVLVFSTFEKAYEVFLLAQQYGKARIYEVTRVYGPPPETLNGGL